MIFFKDGGAGGSCSSAALLNPPLIILTKRCSSKSYLRARIILQYSASRIYPKMKLDTSKRDNGETNTIASATVSSLSTKILSLYIVLLTRCLFNL